jgi:hypothetical protein
MIAAWRALAQLSGDRISLLHKRRLPLSSLV